MTKFHTFIFATVKMSYKHVKMALFKLLMPLNDNCRQRCLVTSILHTRVHAAEITSICGGGGAYMQPRSLPSVAGGGIHAAEITSICGGGGAYMQPRSLPSVAGGGAYMQPRSLPSVAGGGRTCSHHSISTSRPNR